MMRMALLLVLPLVAGAAGPYAGTQVCGQCHPTQAARYHGSPMARALASVAACDILKQHPKLTFAEGPYTSQIIREGDRSILTVTNGAQKFTTPLLWAFGRGQAGQTYVFESNGALYESRVSFYNAIRGLDLTMGAQASSPSTIEEAAGRRMDASGARDCFGCHSTGAVSQGKLQLESLSPGVACEACHGPAANHIEAIRSGKGGYAKPPKLSSLGAEEMSELCGRCHRTWSQIALNGPRGINNIRFQPYRLTNSKCYDATDRRIRCSACHDPHGPVETSAGYYDAKCAACHSSAPKLKTCTVAKQNCVTCHMPNWDLPGSHAQFSDHQIRIARANESYPN
jgi:hypothetical protein